MEGREITDEPYRYGYQGQFSEKDLTTGWQQFELRNYDPKYGRWISPDPYGQYASPYVGMGNNPVNSVDPNGGISFPVLPQSFWQGIADLAFEASLKATGVTVLQNVLVTAARETPKTAIIAAGLARVAYAQSQLGKKTYNNDGNVVRGGSPYYELKFNDKYTDCIESCWDVLKNTDPKVYAKTVGKDKYGREYGNVETFKTKIKENFNAEYRWNDPMAGDIAVFKNHVEIVESVEQIHGKTYVTLIGSGSNKTPVPRRVGISSNGTRWLEATPAGLSKVSSNPLGFWTPPLLR
jgi:RHS repeat-associated protein